VADDYEQALQVDVIACSLQMDKSESGDLLEFLAAKLSAALPDDTEITRGGWILSSKRPVVDLTIKLGEQGFQMLREKRGGSLTARQMKIVRGVVLKTEEVGVEQWVQNLAAALSHQAEKNNQTRQALQKFVIG
jgi:hypothetical protein